MIEVENVLVLKDGVYKPVNNVFDITHNHDGNFEWKHVISYKAGTIEASTFYYIPFDFFKYREFYKLIWQ